MRGQVGVRGKPCAPGSGAGSSAAESWVSVGGKFGDDGTASCHLLGYTMLFMPRRLGAELDTGAVGELEHAGVDFGAGAEDRVVVGPALDNHPVAALHRQVVFPTDVDADAAAVVGEDELVFVRDAADFAAKDDEFSALYVGHAMEAACFGRRGGRGRGGGGGGRRGGGGGGAEQEGRATEEGNGEEVLAGVSGLHGRATVGRMCERANGPGRFAEAPRGPSR